MNDRLTRKNWFKAGQYTLILISYEILMVRGWLTPQNNQVNTKLVSLSLSNNVYTLGHRKCNLINYWCDICWHLEMSTNNKFAFLIIYTSDYRKCSYRFKKTSKYTLFPNLMNYWSFKVGSSLICVSDNSYSSSTLCLTRCYSRT